MTTLAIMKTRIGTELRRTGLTTQIAAAIQTAIEAYEHERFAFSETREITFSTVVDQEFYDADDAAALARMTKLDFVKIQLDANTYDLQAISPTDIENLNSGGTFTGQPLNYCWYQEQLRLYPVPQDVYTIRVGAVVEVAAPATDEETGNAWMTTAERLIRCRAKFEMYEHVLLDREMADRFNPDRDGSPTSEALKQLMVRTTRKTQQGGYLVEPTRF